MFLSMTGFGSSSCEFSWGNVIIEISSVNHKFQDFSVRLPKELLSLENRILNLMRSSIKRGKVKLSASIVWNPGSEIPLINEAGLINLYGQIKNIAVRNGLEVSNDITNLLLIPGLFESTANAAELAALENPEIWDEAVIDAINSLMDMKKSEGEKLKFAVEKDFNSLDKTLADMSERWKIARDSALESIRARIEAVLAEYNLELDEARIAEEVALAADRWDVSEEIARMESHLEKFRQTMDSGESSGKKLDFLIQEMIREMNTAGSKAADSEVRWLVVEAKTYIEKIREQIQNVE